jgi:hypothetical protein
MFNYVVIEQNDGSTYIHYKLPSGKNVSHFVPIKQLVNDYINNHIIAIRSLINRFITLPIEQLLSDKEMIEIVNNLEHTIPPPNYHNNINTFHKEQILSAYNKIHHTTIIIEEL